MMLDDLVPLDLAVRYLRRFFEIVVLFLPGEEALHLVVLQGESLPSDLRQVMDEANHSIRAL